MREKLPTSDEISFLGVVFGKVQDVPGWEVLQRMRKKNFKGRCEKRIIGKCTEVCRTYDAIQYAYADLLQKSDEVKEIKCNVLLEGLEVGEYTSDFVCIKTDGDLMVRECVFRKFLTKPLTVKLLDASREYWLRHGVTNLLGHQLENLPWCKAVFEKCTESHPESWARKIIWAYRKLEEERKPFYWTDIRRVSGVKKKNLQAVVPYLMKYMDADMVSQIIELIEFQ